jgi:hypothetical protein
MKTMKRMKKTKMEVVEACRWPCGTGATGARSAPAAEGRVRIEK